MPITKENAKEIGSLGGRPARAMTADQKLKFRTELEIRKLGYRRAKKIINAQTIAALGTHKMIVIRKVQGKNVAIKITDEKEINRLLDEGEYGVDYLVVVGTMPDAKAGNMILDRIYGKAKETLDLNLDVKFSLKDLEARRTKEMIDMSSDVEIIDPRILLKNKNVSDEDMTLDMPEENVSVEA